MFAKLITVTLLIISTIGSFLCAAQSNKEQKHSVEMQSSSLLVDNPSVVVGAERFDNYLSLLKGKRVAVLVNQTSLVNTVHLVDTLRSLGVNIVKIFSPEHGFRGSADAGAKVNSSIDEKTSLPIISLYGKNKKPTNEQLSNVDVVVYDLQDVGVRFYTYISSLEYLMEACGALSKPIIVLDRPNPLGWIVDGPVLDKKFKSFVGMQSIPIVYGMTVGEYANMLIGEKWIQTTNIDLTVIPLLNWNHNTAYELPIAPSPNLKNMAAIYLYPSLCFFEGTAISLGRGTTMPFQMFGHPDLKQAFPNYSFTPKSVLGATNPPLLNKLCYGKLVAATPQSALKAIDGKLQIQWLLDAYKSFPNKEIFFNKDNFINLLAGTDEFKNQIIAGKSEAEIRASWEPKLQAFKKIRNKYLLYP